MAKLSKTFPHSLGKETAARLIRERISSEKISKAHVATVTKEVWNDPYNLDFALTIFNYKINGDLKIEDASLTVNVDLPMGASLFKGMIEDQLSQQIELMLK